MAGLFDEDVAAVLSGAGEGVLDGEGDTPRGGVVPELEGVVAKSKGVVVEPEAGRGIGRGFILGGAISNSKSLT